MHARLILWALCFAWAQTAPGSATGYPITSDQRGDDVRLSTAPGLRKLLVVGGNDAPEDRFPYLCSLRTIGSNSHGCGGALVAPEWILTVASCFDNNVLSRAPLVYVGAHGVNDDEFAEVIKATEVIIHERWDGDIQNGFDIALVRLSRAATRKTPVQMAQIGTVIGDGQLLVTAGWGRLATSGPLAAVLQFADRMMHVSNRNCARSWPNLLDSMLCSFSTLQGPCAGDSGAPLLLGHASRDGNVADGDPDLDLLVGIASFGPRDCAGGSPDVFTSVSSFRPWIDATMEGSSSASVPTPVQNP